MHLQVGTDTVGEVTVVTASGELDLHTAPTLGEALTAAVAAEAPVLVVDLAGVDFMDSTGLSVIVAAVAGARTYGGVVRVVTSAERITKVFTLTGVDQQVALYGSRDEALAG